MPTLSAEIVNISLAVYWFLKYSLFKLKHVLIGIGEAFVSLNIACFPVAFEVGLLVE